MESPSAPIRVKVDAQGRLVLPQQLRREIVAAPGEVLLRRTPEGLLLSPVAPDTRVEEGPDGLPVLRLGRPVANDDVLAAIDAERALR